MNLEIRRLGALIATAGITSILTVGYIVYAGRVLEPAGYADFSAALAVIYLFAVALSPVTPTIARLVAQYAVRSDILAAAALRRVVMKWVLMLVLAVGTILFLLAEAIARALHFRSTSTLLLSFLAALLFAVLSVDRGVTQGLMRFGLYNVNSLVEAAVRAGGGVILLILVPSAAAALVSYVAALVVAEVMLAIRFGREWRGYPTRDIDWRELLRLALPMMVLMFAVAVFQNCDVLAVKRWFPPAEAGVYGAGSAIARGFGVVFVPLYVVAGPLLTEAFASGRAIRALTIRLCAIFLVLSAGPLALFILWPQRIMTLLYGEGYAAAGPLVGRIGGVAILTYTALMLAQALITVADFRFLRIYGLGALVQIAALVLHHGTYGEVITALYVPQTIVLILVIISFFKCSKLSSPVFTTTRPS